MSPLAVMGLSIQELLVILVILLLLFGARKIPDIARGLGQGVRELRKSLRGDEEKTGEADEKEGAPKGSGTA